MLPYCFSEDATRPDVVFNDARAFGHKKAGSFVLLAAMTPFYERKGPKESHYQWFFYVARKCEISLLKKLQCQDISLQFPATKNQKFMSTPRWVSAKRVGVLRWKGPGPWYVMSMAKQVPQQAKRWQIQNYAILWRSESRSPSSPCVGFDWQHCRVPISLSRYWARKLVYRKTPMPWPSRRRRPLMRGLRWVDVSAACGRNCMGQALFGFAAGAKLKLMEPESWEGGLSE